MKKILHIFLSLILVYATTTNSYASPSSWAISKALSVGARTVVTATSGGYKAAVNLSPTAARVALTVLKRGNQAYMIYAISGLIGDGLDYVLDEQNNRVKYKDPSATPFVWVNQSTRETGSNPRSVTQPQITQINGSSGRNFQYGSDNCPSVIRAGVSCTVSYPDADGSGLVSRIDIYARASQIPDKYLSAQQVAQKVISNANDGHAPSKEYTKSTALEMVATGDFDSDLLSGAVPQNDSRPLVPAVPGNRNGNVTSGSDVGDGTMTGGDVGAAADDARAAADAAKKAAQAAADAARAAADDARRAADDAVDVVNSAVDQALKDIAKKAADDAKKVADDAKAVEDRAKKVADEAAKEAVKTAEKVREAADKREKELRDAYDKALEEDKALALEKVKEAEKALEEAKEKVKEAEKAAEKAKDEVPKLVEFPAFCTWAKPVCDAIDWIKKDPVAVAPELVPVDDAPADSSATDFDVNYVNFGGQCPVLPSFNIGVGLNVTPMTFDMTPLCEIAVAIRPAIIAMAYFIGLGIVASSIRGT